MECPKCKYEPTMAENAASPEICPKCGVVYAKVQAKQEAAAQPVTGKVAAGIAGAKAGVAASRQQREERDWQARLNAAAPDCVVVTGVQIPFLSLIWLMTKIILAALPALVLAVFIVWALFSFVKGVVTSYNRYTDRYEQTELQLALRNSASAASELASSSGRCSTMAELGSAVMLARQNGLPMAAAKTAVSGHGEYSETVLSQIVTSAYRRDRHETDSERSQQVDTFRRETYEWCVREGL